MGGSKREMEAQQARYDEGLAICLDAQAIQECENHSGTYFEGSQPVEEAYKLAARLVKAGKVSGPQSDVTDSVKLAYEDNSALDSCPECDEAFGPG